MFLIPPTPLQSGAKETCLRLCLALLSLLQNYLLQADAKEACPRLCLALPSLLQNYLLQSGAKETCLRLCLALPSLLQNHLLQVGAKEACLRLCLALPSLLQNHLSQAGAKEACLRLCLALPSLLQNHLLQSGAKEACLRALPHVAESAAKSPFAIGRKGGLSPGFATRCRVCCKITFCNRAQRRLVSGLCHTLLSLLQNHLLQAGAKEACLRALPHVAEPAAKIRVKFGNGTMLIGQKTILIGHSASGPNILIGHFMLVTC